MTLYPYVGPQEIAARVTHDGGDVIDSPAALATCLQTILQRPLRREHVTVTFVIDRTGALRLADRHSEHVECAGGQAVLSAGEMTFRNDDNEIVIEQVTNLSTGYCPAPSSWSAVTQALDGIPVARPDSFDPAFVFRRCPSCAQISVVKDGWYECAVCHTPLAVD